MIREVGQRGEAGDYGLQPLGRLTGNFACSRCLFIGGRYGYFE
jgi:hypothetical protein